MSIRCRGRVDLGEGHALAEVYWTENQPCGDLGHEAKEMPNVTRQSVRDPSPNLPAGLH